jgi:ArsR family transcriptional regulator
MKDFYRLHADICKTIANPKRLEILNLLRGVERHVGDLAEQMGVSAANVSQQLAVLHGAGVVSRRRDGTTVFYRIANPKIMKAYDLMTEVMKDTAAERARVVRAKRPAKRAR